MHKRSRARLKHYSFIWPLLAIGLSLLLFACGKAPEPVAETEAQNVAEAQVSTPPPVSESAKESSAPISNPLRNAYFGAVHVHTSYSFDAFTNGTVSVPSDAYNWAKGKAIRGNKEGLMIKIDTPLDFYAVSDHAEMMGVFNQMIDPNSPLSKLPLAKEVTSPDQNVAIQAFAGVLRDLSMGELSPELTDPAISRSVWSEIVATADQFYAPGEFTTFPAFEWSANPGMRNLHRVVLFRDSDKVPDLPLSALQSTKPEVLWEWMDTQRENGSTLLAIPHNGNASDGLMFSLVDSEGEPLNVAEIEARSRNEPLYEISQIKGTSETNPALSPNDEFADFEIWNYTLSADAIRPTNMKGSYARKALLDGINFERMGMGNPFKYGFIGDTDTHNAAASNEEFNYTGKFAFETSPVHRLEGVPGQPPAQAQQIREFSSGGLAGVWAEENTRGAIYDAMIRKETFGTSGTHLKLRFFGGFRLSQADSQDTDWVAAGYARGVPMGGQLQTSSEFEGPTFIAWALKDPKSGNLDRIQIIKGWVDDGGNEHEKIYDVAWSDGRSPDPDTGKIPAVGNTVDPGTVTYTNTIGDSELFAIWSDPDFDPGLNAFYYARVLEIPTPRWSTRDAVNLQIEVPEGLAHAIQERAWSSPIWYTPEYSEE